MILLIDNYDSFAHNLGRYVENTGSMVTIIRNDKISVSEISDLKPDAILLSPGPCGPAEAGISLDLIRILGNSIPILGVCLGHQCIAQAYGDDVLRSPKPVHGKTSSISHKNTALFTGIPTPFSAGRYHSLMVDIKSNSPLTVTARSEDDVIMAVEHKNYPVYGVQFHPESILTAHGKILIENFMKIAIAWNARKAA